MILHKYVCDRKGCVEKSEASIDTEIPEGWRRDYGWGVLCPDCVSLYQKLCDSFEEMRKEFWDGK